MSFNRRSFLKGVAGLVAGVIVLPQIPDIVVPAAAAPPDNVQRLATALDDHNHDAPRDRFRADLWAYPNDVCREHGCRVFSQYSIKHLADGIVHFDPVTNRYVAILVAGIVGVQQNRPLREMYAEKMARSVHRLARQHGVSVRGLSLGALGRDHFLAVWQKVAKAGWFDAGRVSLVMGPAVWVGLLKTDSLAESYILREYRADDKVNVWGLGDASDRGELLGMRVLVSNLLTGDLVVARNAVGKEMAFNLSRLGIPMNPVSHAAA